jgi:hypothetical protein
MDEARRVLERLDRISVLRVQAARPAEMLAELRALLAEGEAWVVAEGAGTDRARLALGDLRDALEPGDDRVGRGVSAETVIP